MQMRIVEEVVKMAEQPVNPVGTPQKIEEVDSYVDMLVKEWQQLKQKFLGGSRGSLHFPLSKPQSLCLSVLTVSYALSMNWLITGQTKKRQSFRRFPLSMIM